MNSIYKNYEARWIKKVKELCAETPDPSHDFMHIERVVETAKRLAFLENANLDIIVPAAYLHDFVLVSKSDPRRKQASRLSAEAALPFLREMDYPENLYPFISHAIHAHSFSANIQPETLEAKIVQDADRLDGLGAIGIARCFCISGLLKRDLYSAQDPFAQDRIPDDQQNSLDHFFIKLFKVVDQLQTPSGQIEGQKRLKTMKSYLAALREEIVSIF